MRGSVRATLQDGFRESPHSPLREQAWPEAPAARPCCTAAPSGSRCSQQQQSRSEGWEKPSKDDAASTLQALESTYMASGTLRQHLRHRSTWPNLHTADCPASAV